jgi:hypothetical protein
LVFSSSHHDIKYIKPLDIKAITAITATNCINSQIILEITSVQILSSTLSAVGFFISESLHQGNHIQLITGAGVTAYVFITNKFVINITNNVIILFFIILIYF